MAAQEILKWIKGEQIFWWNKSSGSACGYTELDSELFDMLKDAEVLELDEHLPEDVWKGITDELTDYLDKDWGKHTKEYRVLRVKNSENNEDYFLVWL